MLHWISVQFCYINVYLPVRLGKGGKGWGLLGWTLKVWGWRVKGVGVWLDVWEFNLQLGGGVIGACFTPFTPPPTPARLSTVECVWCHTCLGDVVISYNWLTKHSPHREPLWINTSCWLPPQRFCLESTAPASDTPNPSRDTTVDGLSLASHHEYLSGAVV